MPKTLTDTLIRSAQVPERGQVMIVDATLPNFGLRLSQGGSKTFVVILGNGRRYTVGHYPTISLADARKEARRILAEKELGRIRPTFTAFEDAVASFLKDCETRCRLRTVKDYTRLLRHLPYGRTALADITAAISSAAFRFFPPRRNTTPSLPSASSSGGVFGKTLLNARLWTICSSQATGGHGSAFYHLTN